MDMSTNTKTHADLSKVKRLAGSDHSPVGSTITPRSMKAEGDLPIPKWIAKHEIFLEKVAEILEYYNEKKPTHPTKPPMNSRRYPEKPPSERANKYIKSLQKTPKKNSKLFSKLRDAFHSMTLASLG